MNYKLLNFFCWEGGFVLLVF